MSQPIFRFAPSPNGPLHLGHALSALMNAKLAGMYGGLLLLRFDDNDKTRARAQYEAQILDDLTWLGISWTGEPLRLSKARKKTNTALNRLRKKGLTYPARLSRRQVGDIASTYKNRTGQNWPRDPDGALLYPGQDYELQKSGEFQHSGPASERLNLKAVCNIFRDQSLSWQEFDERGHASSQTRALPVWGDVLLRSKAGDDSYTFATVLDDAQLGITHIVRGMDLQENTCVQRALQNILGLPVPLYHHHSLVLDEAGKKLSKSDGALSLSSLRAGGATRDDVLNMVGLKDRF